MERPALFTTYRSFFIFLLAAFVLLGVHLLFKYHQYQEFVSKPFYYTYATVQNTYKKRNSKGSYTVLKLKSKEGLRFYTTTHKKGEFHHKRLRVQIFPNKRIKFRDFLGIFYIKSKIKDQEKVPSTFKDRLLEKVASQHDTKEIQTFYNAIFFATPLDTTLREQIAKLGVSHLVALSGFHLGILWGIVYGVLYFIYRPIQQRYFPYRYALFDVGIVAMGFLGVYVWFVDFPPSLVRSYAMVLVGWGVLLLGMRLLSFTFLTTILLILVILFPSLLVSLSFWLSVFGVFYIFLLLQYTKAYSTKVISFIVIPLGIFLLMLPVVHTVFGVTSVYQLFSPILSILFVAFYPLVMLLHLLGLGGTFDNALLWLFSLPTQSVEHVLPLWVAALYTGLSIIAIWYRNVFYAIFGFSILYGFYLFL